MPRKSTMPLPAYKRCREVRAARQRIPTNAELAAELGVPLSLVLHATGDEGIKSLEQQIHATPERHENGDGV